MMLVIDANILFAALIKNSTTRRIFSENSVTLFAPDYIIAEFQRDELELIKKANITKGEFDEVFSALTRLIILEPIPAFFFEEARKFCPDKKDIAYFAVCLKLDIPLWSNERRLKKQDRIKVYDTKELMRQLNLL